jgi:hypothetical protein
MDLNNFLPPLMGSFFGVIIAFISNYAYQSYNTNQDKKKFKNMIRLELEHCITILELDYIQLLPVDRWTSAVNSGALKLFEVDNELQSLSVNYYRIKIYNDMLVKEKYQGRLIFDLSITLPKSSSQKFFFNYRNSLLNELKKLESAEWLNTDLVPVIKADEVGAYWKRST